MIRQVFASRYLICGHANNKSVVRLVDTSSSILASVDLMNPSTNKHVHISMIIEARRCKDKVCLVAIDCINRIHVMTVSNDRIEVVKQSIDSGNVNYSTVVDCRLDNRSDIYAGINGGSLKKLTIKFNK